MLPTADERRRRSRQGILRTLAWCGAHLDRLRGFVSAQEISALQEVYEGRRLFDPAGYTALFNLFQILPEVARPDDVRLFTLGDALEALALLHLQAREGALPLDDAALSPRERTMVAALSGAPLTVQPSLSPRELRALGHDGNVAGLDASRQQNLEGWQVHGDAHQRVVLAAVDAIVAARGRPRRIAYLGAARTYDVPVQALTERCQELVLVDIDAEALTGVHAAFPAAVRDRVSVQARDLTGVGAWLLHQTDRILAGAADAGSAAEELGALAASYVLSAPPPLVDGAVDLVVSGMLLSQLGYALATYPRRALRARFGTEAAFDRGPCAAAFHVFPLLVQQDHVAALAATAPAFVISSDVAEEEIIGDVSGELVPSGHEVPTIGARRLSDRLPHDLRVTLQQGWHWYRALPRRVGGRGTRLRVDALAVTGPA